MSKFKVEFRPDTLQLVYMDMPNVEVIPEILRFNDGSYRVTIDGIGKMHQRYCTITAFIESMDDLMVVAQIKNIIDNTNPTCDISLEVDGTAYTRYDRVMFADKSDAFGAKVFADFINSINFSYVIFKDPHSEVITDLVNRAVCLHQKHLLKQSVFDLEEFGIVCPDKGARKKLEAPAVTCEKVRNPETGKISKVAIASTVHGSETKFKKFLVVDDICEGGGTFMGIADAFKEDERFKDKELYLYVTHGIFSRNAIPKLLEKYIQIYVYSMKESIYNGLTLDQQSKVNVVKFL